MNITVIKVKHDGTRCGFVTYEAQDFSAYEMLKAFPDVSEVIFGNDEEGYLSLHRSQVKFN